MIENQRKFGQTTLQTRLKVIYALQWLHQAEHNKDIESLSAVMKENQWLTVRNLENMKLR